jgi:hypothetical protein
MIERRRDGTPWLLSESRSAMRSFRAAGINRSLKFLWQVSVILHLSVVVALRVPHPSVLPASGSRIPEYLAGLASRDIAA